jgi:polar amino acid transport system permease protein
MHVTLGAAVSPMLGIEFDWNLLVQRLFNPGRAFFGALVTTVLVAIVAMIFGIVLGFVAWLGTRSSFRPLRVLSYLYVLVFRGTPIIVQIFFVFFGANLFLGFDLFPRSLGAGWLIIPGAVIAGTVALSLNEGAFMSEVIRAGIDSIDPGQMEAARSVGMTRRLAMRRIILPQAARVILPPLGNEFNAMFKTTSLLAFIGVYELFRDAQVTYSQNFQPVEVFIAVALWYLLLTTAWSLVQVQLERKFGASDIQEGESWVTRFLGIQAHSGRGVR